MNNLKLFRVYRPFCHPRYVWSFAINSKSAIDLVQTQYGFVSNTSASEVEINEELTIPEK